MPNTSRWANMGLNPGGSRNGELFTRGVRAQFKKLRTKINRGQPVPLGFTPATAIVPIGAMPPSGRRALSFTVPRNDYARALDATAFDRSFVPV